jgi:hypothetical protein
MLIPANSQIRAANFKHHLLTITGGCYGLLSLCLLIVLPFGGFGSHWIAPTALIFGFVIFIFWEWKSAERRVQKILDLVNAQCGTRYQLGESLGFLGKNDKALFDPQSKKMLLIKLSGRLWWLVDFKEIDKWTLHWTDSTERAMSGKYVVVQKNPRIEFYFFNSQLTRLTMAIRNIDDGRYWSHRMETLVR